MVSTIADRPHDVGLDVLAGDPQGGVLEGLGRDVDAGVGAGRNGDFGVERELLEESGLVAGLDEIEELHLVAGGRLDHR
jgi:hypothetical protein